MSTRSLRSQLVFGVVIVITTFVAVQLCIRAFVTYPQLKALSEQHDFYELQRVASEIQQELRALENLVYDNAVWDSTYNAIATKDVNWLGKTYFLPTSYTTLGIDGWPFFDKHNNVVAAEVLQSTLPLDEINQAVTTSGIFDAVEQQSTVHTVFSMLRDTDHAFRFGGEEFTVILQNTNLNDAKTVADNIRKHVENINYAHDESPISDYITISVGVAAKAPGEQLNESELFADADRALYQAKAKGRNTVCSA